MRQRVWRSTISMITLAWPDAPITKMPSALTRAPHEFRHGGVACLADPPAAKNGGEGARQDSQIEPKTPVFDIPDIQGKLGVPVKRIAAVHRAPAGYAWAHAEAAALGCGIPWQVCGQQRPGPHQAHVASEHVPKLGQFVEAPRPENRPYSGQPGRIVEQPAGTVPRLGHGAKFPKPENPSVQPGAVLRPEHRRTVA